VHIIEKIAAEISGQNAYDLTREITRYHRAPGSGGYHAATNLLRDRLIADRLQVKETRYPLDGSTVVLDRTMPLAWEAHGATVSVISPVQERIVDFELAGSCIAWWSTSTPDGGLEAELVDVGTGEDEQDYAGKDLTGKIAFVHNANWHVTWSHVSETIAKKGARGIITDFFLYPSPPIRTREKVPQAVQLLRLEFNAKRQYDFWACSVDHPTGARIKEWLELGPVRARANIRCETFVGYGQNILASIEGAELPEESVFVLAHSSTGSRPGANCAAGAALLAEIARALNHLVLADELPRPRRSVKFLLVSEGLGSYQYLSEHAGEIPRIKSSYCLESVGHSQRKINGTMYFCRAPDSTPSFVNDHFAAVYERLPKQWGWVGRNERDISPIVVSEVPYTPWSDNSTWAAHGIPSTLFMAWPDEYFHSQLLTVDVTEPGVFAHVGAMVAASAYEVASAGRQEACWLAHWIHARSVARLHHERQRARWRGEAVDDWTIKRLEYLCRRDCQALGSLSLLVDGADLPPLNEKISRLQEQLISVKDQLLAER
jgi:aminopeptidase YwaD